MGCHSYQQVFRNRYDEQGWELILQRMLRSGSSTLFGSLVPTETTIDRAGRPMLENEAFLAKWLARVRGPDSTNAHLQYLPRERGRSTRVVVTEYELPRELLAPHDVHGDADGNIWYTAHRSPYVGVLDPDTGIVTEHRIPDKAQATPGALPGTHRVWIDDEGLVRFSEGWASRLTALDPRSGQVVRRFDQCTPEGQRVFQANFAMDAEGYAYTTRGQRGGGARVVAKTDGETGEVVQQFPLRTLTTYNYDNIVTPDGRFWAGGAYMGHRIGWLGYPDRGDLGGRHPNQAVKPGSRSLRPGRQRLVGRTWRHADQDRSESSLHHRVSATDSVRDVLRGDAGHERRDLGRRVAVGPLLAVRSEDRAVDRLHDAGTLRPRSPHVDRQLHRSGHDLVCGP